MEAISNVYVINLDRHTERLDKFQIECKTKIGLTPKRIEGVDGAKLSSEQFKDATTVVCSNICTKSLVGCGLSHKTAWQTAYNNGDSMAMICEDDCYFSDNFKDDFLKVYNDLPQDYDILFLGCEIGCSIEENYSWYSTVLFSIGHMTKIKSKSFMKITDNIYKPEWALAAHCYIISRAGMEKLLNGVPKINYHIDAQMNGVEDIVIYSSNPKIAFQDASLFTTSNISTNYPYLINRVCENIKDIDGRPYSYNYTIPIAQIGPFPFNTWMIFIFVLGLISGRISKDYVLLYAFIILNSIEVLVFPKHVYAVILAIVLYTGAFRLTSKIS